MLTPAYTTIYWGTPVYHSILEYSSLPQYTWVLQCTTCTVYWGTPVYHSILGYSSVPQYTRVLQYTTVYQCTPVYHSTLGYSSVPQYTRVLQYTQGTPVPAMQVLYLVYTCILSLSLNNFLLSKVSVELHFEHSYDITPALFAGKVERAVY